MNVPYRDSAAAYDLIHGARHKDYVQEAAVVADRVRGHRPNARTVLDVACGTGLHLEALAGLGFVVEGRRGRLPVQRDRLHDHC